MKQHRESLCRQLFNSPYSALIGRCIATSVSIVTWRQQHGCEQWMIRKCSAATVTKQNHYLWNCSAHTHAHKHICAYAHIWKHPSALQHHTLIAVILSGCHLIFKDKMQAEPRKWNKMAHLSQQYLSTGNKFSFHYTLCKRQSSALNEMCMTPRWLSDPLDWEMGT